MALPFTLLVFFLLLYLGFRRSDEAALIMTTLPFSVIVGFWYLYLRDHDLSVASAVGFIALAGVAAEIGVVTLLYLRQAIERRRAAGTESPLRERFAPRHTARALSTLLHLDRARDFLALPGDVRHADDAPAQCGQIDGFVALRGTNWRGFSRSEPECAGKGQKSFARVACNAHATTPTPKTGRRLTLDRCLAQALSAKPTA